METIRIPVMSEDLIKQDTELCVTGVIIGRNVFFCKVYLN
jgi:hypothetical protein